MKFPLMFRRTHERVVAKLQNDVRSHKGKVAEFGSHRHRAIVEVEAIRVHLHALEKTTGQLRTAGEILSRILRKDHP